MFFKWEGIIEIPNPFHQKVSCCHFNVMPGSEARFHYMNVIGEIILVDSGDFSLKPGKKVSYLLYKVCESRENSFDTSINKYLLNRLENKS
jgi:hypothetical protein